MSQPQSAGSLAGKVALVTGASSGIGEATAVALAEAGAAVALAARRTDRLESLAERLGATGARVLTLELDVTDEAACRAAVQRTTSELGGLDVRVSLVEPGAVATELTDHITHAESKEAAEGMYASMRALESEDIARAILYVVSQPDHVAINEILVRPTDQVS